MKVRSKLGFVIGLVSVVLAAPGTWAQSKPAGLSVSGSLYGQLDLDPSNPARRVWIAKATFRVGDEVLSANIIDRTVTRSAMNPSGTWSGAELWIVSFADGSTFQFESSYQVSAGSAPGMYFLHETGSIINGTGRFQNASGELTVQGPFVLPPGWGPGDPKWISQIHGNILGFE